MSVNSPLGLGFDEIYSTPQLTGSKLPTEITFTIPQDAKKWILGRNSYISIKLNIVQTDENGVQGPLRPIVNSGTRAAPTAISIPYISQNAGICFFNNVSCYVDTTQVSQISELQQTNTLYRMLWESKEEQRVNAQNSIVPPNIDDVDTSLGAIYDNYVAVAKAINPAAPPSDAVGSRLTKHMIWALKNQQFNFDKYTENELEMQVPLPLFMAEEPFFVGTGKKIILRFTVDPLYHQNLICIAGSPKVASGEGNVGGGDYTVQQYTHPLQAAYRNIINVAVTDMKLYACVAHLEETAIPRSVSINMKQFSPAIRPLLTSSSNSFTIDLKQFRRMSHIAICLINRTNEAFHQSPCDFTAGFTSTATGETYLSNNQINNLYQVWITFNSVKYPMTEYTLLTTNYGTTNDMARSWYETLVNCDSLRDRSGHLIDFKTFQASPIFVWRTFQGLKQASNTANININLRSTIPNKDGTTSQPNYTSNISAFILGLYDESYNLQFDDQFRCISESLDASPI